MLPPAEVVRQEIVEEGYGKKLTIALLATQMLDGTDFDASDYTVDMLERFLRILEPRFGVKMAFDEFQVTVYVSTLDELPILAAFLGGLYNADEASRHRTIINVYYEVIVDNQVIKV